MTRARRIASAPAPMLIARRATHLRGRRPGRRGGSGGADGTGEVAGRERVARLAEARFGRRVPQPQRLEGVGRRDPGRDRSIVAVDRGLLGGRFLRRGAEAAGRLEGRPQRGRWRSARTSPQRPRPRSARRGRPTRRASSAVASSNCQARIASRTGRGSRQSPAFATTCVVLRPRGPSRVEQRRVRRPRDPGPPQVVERLPGVAIEEVQQAAPVRRTVDGLGRGCGPSSPVPAGG